MRRTGNNYSGPRWAFSQSESPMKPAKAGGGGMSIMGGSNRKTEVHYDDCTCPEKSCPIHPAAAE